MDPFTQYVIERGGAIALLLAGLAALCFWLGRPRR
jgi:hypothetical protein